MEFIRKTVRVGNSSGVILPKRLLGSEVKIIVVNNPINIKKEALKLLDTHLSDILGIYIINKKPAEVLAITTSIREIIGRGNVKVILVPLSIIKKDLKINQQLKQKIITAEPILNKALLSELKKEVRS